jgi:hypothetical protein
MPDAAQGRLGIVTVFPAVGKLPFMHIDSPLLTTDGKQAKIKARKGAMAEDAGN